MQAKVQAMVNIGQGSKGNCVLIEKSRFVLNANQPVESSSTMLRRRNVQMFVASIEVVILTELMVKFEVTLKHFLLNRLLRWPMNTNHQE